MSRKVTHSLFHYPVDNSVDEAGQGAGFQHFFKLPGNHIISHSIDISININNMCYFH